MRRVIFLLALGIGCGGPAASRARAVPGPATAFPVDVRIPARGLDLEGTLAVPRGRGPWPAVVLVQGSGPLGRDEVLPCVTHAFNCMRTDARDRPASIARHIDARVPARVIAFLRRHLPR